MHLRCLLIWSKRFSSLLRLSYKLFKTFAYNFGHLISLLWTPETQVKAKILYSYLLWCNYNDLTTTASFNNKDIFLSFKESVLKSIAPRQSNNLFIFYRSHSCLNITNKREKESHRYRISLHSWLQNYSRYLWHKFREEAEFVNCNSKNSSVKRFR